MRTFMRKSSLLIGFFAATLLFAGCGGSSHSGAYDIYDPGYYNVGVNDPDLYLPDPSYPDPYLPDLVPIPDPNPDPAPDPNPGSANWTLHAYYDNYETPAGTRLSVLDSWDSIYSNDSYKPDVTYVELPSRRTQQGGYLSYWRPSNGTFEYDPPSDTFTGRDQFTYTLKDDFGRSSTATVYIDVY